MKFICYVPIKSRIGSELIPITYETTGVVEKFDGKKYLQVISTKGFIKFIAKKDLEKLEDGNLVKILEE